MNLTERTAKPRSAREISAIAQKIRTTINNPDGYFDVLHFIEYILPQAVPGFTLRIVNEDDNDIDMYGIEAVTVINPNGVTMFLREETYDGARRGNGRNRFTAAHELAHVILHSRDTAVLSRFSNSENEATHCHPDCNAEIQANVFAAELLAPAYTLKGLTLNEIIATYKVSRTVAEIQRKKSYR